MSMTFDSENVKVICKLYLFKDEFGNEKLRGRVAYCATVPMSFLCYYPSVARITFASDYRYAYTVQYFEGYNTVLYLEVPPNHV